MKKGLIVFMLMACPWLLAAYGCDDDKGGGDADTDVTHDPVPDIDVTPDPAGDPDVTGDPDVMVDPDVVPEIIDTTPDTTGCNPLEGGTCSLVDSCGCDAGQICDIFLNPDDTCDIIEGCDVATGTLPTGSECDPANDQCAMGNSCLTSGGESKCYKWCDGDEDCEAGRNCNITITLTMTDPCEDVQLAYRACDQGCPADALCDPFTGSGCTEPEYNSCLYDTACTILQCGPSDSSVAVGASCVEANLCPIGAECLSSDGGVTANCYALCNSSNACSTGTCTPFNPPYPADTSLGYCPL